MGASILKGKQFYIFAKNYLRMTLIKSISGIRGTIGGKVGEGLSPIDTVRFTAAYGSWIKSKTGNKYIWLRSTGSTVISQLVDSYVVLFIGFVITGNMSFTDYLMIAPTNYVLKLLIGVALTPLIYAGHFSVRKYLSKA